MRIDAVGIAGSVDPGLRDEPGGIDYERVVVFPVPDRVAVVLWIKDVFAPAAHVGRKGSSVRPHFTPEIHVLEQDQGPIRYRHDRHPTILVDHVLRKTKRIAVAGMRIVGASGAESADRLVPGEQLLA